MIKFILLALLGIVINFLGKFMNSKTKMKEFDPKFWLKDNLPELLMGLLFTIVALILLLDPETTFDDVVIYQKIASNFPFMEGIFLPLKSLSAVAIGLFINHVVYWYIKIKIKK